MATTIAEFRAWLVAPREGSHLEFKEARTQFDYEKVQKYCVAFANEGGGKLILGVTDPVPRTVVGTSAFQDPNDIQRKLLERFHFRTEFEEMIYEGKR